MPEPQSLPYQDAASSRLTPVGVGLQAPALAPGHSSLPSRQPPVQSSGSGPISDQSSGQGSDRIPDPVSGPIPGLGGGSRPWDARLARWLVTPLRHSWVTPNHLTTVRLGVGLGGVCAFLPGTYGWSNLAALLVIFSNFLDHTDGELARISGKGSRFGHFYDLASDALITIALFVTMAAGLGGEGGRHIPAVLGGVPPIVLGTVAGVAVALIFWLRMQIEEMVGKDASRQASMGGFETEDVLYLLPLVTLSNGIAPFIVAAAIGAPVFAIWVVYDYGRVVRRLRRVAGGPQG